MDGLQLIHIAAAIVEFFYVVLVKRRPQELLNVTKFADDTFSRFWLLMGTDPLTPFIEALVYIE